MVSYFRKWALNETYKRILKLIVFTDRSVIAERVLWIDERIIRFFSGITTFRANECRDYTCRQIEDWNPMKADLIKKCYSDRFHQKQFNIWRFSLQIAQSVWLFIILMVVAIKIIIRFCLLSRIENWVHNREETKTKESIFVCFVTLFFDFNHIIGNGLKSNYELQGFGFGNPLETKRSLSLELLKKFAITHRISIADQLQQISSGLLLDLIRVLTIDGDPGHPCVGRVECQGLTCHQVLDGHAIQRIGAFSQYIVIQIQFLRTLCGKANKKWINMKSILSLCRFVRSNPISKGLGRSLTEPLMDRSLQIPVQSNWFNIRGLSCVRLVPISSSDINKGLQSPDIPLRPNPRASSKRSSWTYRSRVEDFCLCCTSRQRTTDTKQDKEFHY